MVKGSGGWGRSGSDTAGFVTELTLVDALSVLAIYQLK